MMKIAEGRIAAAWIALGALGTTTAQAQDGGMTSTLGELGSRLVGLLPVIAILAVLGIALFYGLVILLRRTSQPELELVIGDLDPSASRFEQLYAEIQGLSLRVRSGESKGYFRKIEQLVRVFLERMGNENARELSDEELRDLLKQGDASKGQGEALLGIFEHCKQGAERESDRLDFTAGELLKGLYKIVKAAEEQLKPRGERAPGA